MKRIVGNKKSLNLGTLVLATVEVIEQFEPQELVAFNDFKTFFNEVDVMNAYESEWKPEYYKPYYRVIYKSLRGKYK
jgi:hypothetical protein